MYQEPLLQGLVETQQTLEPDDMLYWTYSVIQEAIATKRRVRYTVDYLKYDKNTQSVEKKSEWATLFTPKCIYQTKNNLYMVGFNNTDRRIQAVNLNDITSIKLAFKHRDPKADMVNEWISDIIPQDHIPGECREIIYEGPVTFRCRGQHVGDIYNRFGPPNGPVIKSARCKAIYSLQNATITSEDLHWLSQIPDFNIRIVGPEPLMEAIRNYYNKTQKGLLNPFMSEKGNRKIIKKKSSI